MQAVLVDDLDDAFSHQTDHRIEDEERPATRTRSRHPSHLAVQPHEQEPRDSGVSATTDNGTARGSVRRRSPGGRQAGAPIRPPARPPVQCSAVHAATTGCRAPTQRAARAASPRAAPLRRRMCPVLYSTRKPTPPRPRRPAEPEEQDRDQRTGGKPRRPDEPVAHAAQRAAERRAEALDACRSVPSSSARASAPTASDARYGCALKYVHCRASACGTQDRPAARQLSQRGFHAETDAVADQDLVVPRALNREAAQQHRRACRAPTARAPTATGVTGVGSDHGAPPLPIRPSSPTRNSRRVIE